MGFCKVRGVRGGLHFARRGYQTIKTGRELDIIDTSIRNTQLSVMICYWLSTETNW